MFTQKALEIAEMLLWVDARKMKGLDIGNHERVL